MRKVETVMIHHPPLSTDDNDIETSDSNNDNHSGTGNIYTEGMYQQGLPELLVQDVPRRLTRMVLQTLRRLVDRLRTGQRLYTDTRIVDDGHCYFFRVIEVQHDAYRVHLLHHVMTQWDCFDGRMDDALMNSVALMVLTPWFIEDMEEWGTLPRPPLNRYDYRDKIFLTALLGGDSRGPLRRLDQHASDQQEQGSPSTNERDGVNDNDELFSESDVTYFLMHTDYFLRLLDVPNTPAFLYRMPPSFQRMATAIGNRMRNTTRSRDGRLPLGTRTTTTGSIAAHHHFHRSSPTYIRGRCPRVGIRRAGFRAPPHARDFGAAAVSFSPASSFGSV